MNHEAPFRRDWSFALQQGMQDAGRQVTTSEQQEAGSPPSASFIFQPPLREAMEASRIGPTKPTDSRTRSTSERGMPMPAPGAVDTIGALFEGV